jgi:hypothetical protein
MAATAAITRRAYARIGLLGNPSDGFFGKTIAVSLQNFYAEVRGPPAGQTPVRVMLFSMDGRCPFTLMRCHTSVCVWLHRPTAPCE